VRYIYTSPIIYSSFIFVNFTTQVSYDYSSESGLLHIYIDDLMLKNLGDSEEEKKGVLAGLKKSFNRFYNAFRK